MAHLDYNHRRSNAHGQALVPVIFVMLILTTLAITFATSAHREIRASANFDTQTERNFAARGAVNYAMSALAQTSNNGATYGVIPQSADTDANGWMQIGDAWVKIDAMDTAGLIDLNTVTAVTLAQIPVLQQNPDVVAAMVDWRTAGTTPSPNGAKSEYYNTLTPSYDSKNGPYDSVEELLLVKGVTPTIMYGTPGGTAVDPSGLTGQSSATVAGGSGSAGPSRQANGPPIRSRPGGGSSGPPISSRPGGLGGGSSSGPPISSRPGGASSGPPISSRPGGTGGASGAAGGPAGGSTGGGGGTGGAGTGGAAAAAGDTDWTDIYNAATMPLSEMFTTLSWERNVAADGSARININTATAADLTGIGMAQNLASGLVRFRTSGPTGGGSGGANGGGGGNGGPTGGGSGGRPTTGGGGSGSRPTGGGAAPGTTSPGGQGSGAAPRTQSVSRSGLPGFNGTRQAPGTGAGPTGSKPGGTAPGGATGGGAGPSGSKPGGGAGGGTGGGAGGGAAGGTVFKTIADLLSVQGFTQPVMQQLADKLSVDDKAYHADLVNINTAPQEVLAAIPGMDHTTLQAILAYRQGGQAFQGIGDFFALQGLTRQQYQNVIAHLCTKSSFYRVRVRVRMPGHEALYAVTALVQLTENGPQILQWKEAQRSPGWAYWVPSPSLPTPSPTSSGSGSSSSSPPSGTPGG